MSILDFSNDDDLQKIILPILPKNGETRDSLIDRIADAIEGIGPLVDDQGYSLENAITKIIGDLQLTFKTEFDKQVFIKSLTKAFE